MPDISLLLFEFASHVHIIAFFLLFIAGFNVPISEDLIFIVSASIAATIIPENTVKIATACILGAYSSDIISYCIGRYGIPYILQHPKLIRFYPLDKIAKIQSYYARHGAKTLFFGRFIPFGVRNVIFITAGLAKMKFYKFLAIDFLALSVTSSILFATGYTLGSNYEIILPYLTKYKILAFSICVVFVSMIIYYKKKLFTTDI